jgi:hypothetical protein
MTTLATPADFYSQIPAFLDARGVSDPKNFHEVPSDWHILLTDVKGSTQAIREGRYKDVNLVGASAIAAVLNLCRPIEVPYVFGGDGATFVVPPHLLSESIAVLNSVERMSAREFGLVLRVGSIAVGEVLAQGGSLRIAKQALSDKVHQAIFTGGGLAKAEELIKKREIPSSNTEPQKEASYEGLECRWQPLAAQRGEIVSVLVRAEASGPAENFRIYEEIIEEVEVITGGGQLANPVNRSKLNLTFDPRAIRKEQKIRTHDRGLAQKFWYFLETLFLTSLSHLFFFFKMKAFGTDWDQYKTEVVKNSDFWKFDDMLRFVVDVSAAQRRALESCFELRYLRGELCYGLHSSNAAMLTCLVFSRQGEHIHFVDGGDGGYAMAAVELKRRLKELESKTHISG